ncbi:M43 family zinc metalloprotease [Nonomuraea sp. NPDC050310]|uniref:zinc metalloprotease n=1 Tax=Nonomuraea sp. NPDC050310 TaxID=3154935 RepID=UPI0033F30D92
MARRVTAVALVCLLGLWPAGPVGAAQAAVPRCPDTVPAAEPPDASRREPAGRGPGRLPGPRAPEPGQVASVLAELATRLSGRAAPASVTVPTWVHVLTDGRRRPPDQAVQAQVAALNLAYSGRYGGADTGVRFRLDGVQVVRRADWFADPLGHERPMKAALRRGGPSTLNLYLAQLRELVLGFSTYPHWYEASPQLDGVVVDWRSLPGGSLRNFDLGFTAVHEVGHWLGLFHTFENGCAEPGDGITDTPAERDPTEGCPQGKDTCPAPGADPVHNYMDYGYDRCMTEFTAGQGRRMLEMWAAYRDVAR